MSESLSPEERVVVERELAELSERMVAERQRPAVSGAAAERRVEWLARGEVECARYRLLLEGAC